MRVETQKLRELILSTGTTKTCATRRANETEREGGYMLRALIWGIKTFGPSAPTRVVFIDKSMTHSNQLLRMRANMVISKQFRKVT